MFCVECILFVPVAVALGFFHVYSSLTDWLTDWFVLLSKDHGKNKLKRFIVPSNSTWITKDNHTINVTLTAPLRPIWSLPLLAPFREVLSSFSLCQEALQGEGIVLKPQRYHVVMWRRVMFSFFTGPFTTVVIYILIFGVLWIQKLLDNINFAESQWL